MSWLWFAYFVMGAGVALYVLTAGADFGGGVWDLLARGPRKEDQRDAVAHTIAPLWKANHVWLIFVVVILFTAFPKAFAVVGVALHVPLVLVLVGITLRGTAFTFRAYGIQPDAVRTRWGQVFGWSSLLTPLAMGMVVGGLSSSAIRVTDGRVISDWTAGWLSPFSLAVGVFALVLFALLAAVYLTFETRGELQEDFRKRALITEGVAGVVAGVVLLTSSSGAPDLFAELTRSAWTWPLQLATAAFAALTTAALWRRRYGLARVGVALQVSFVLAGWAAAMGGKLIMRDVAVETAGGHPVVIQTLLPLLIVGLAVLAPSLWWLFRLFHADRAPEARHR